MLALIAGGGALPSLIAQAQPVKPLICSYEGTCAEALETDMTFRLETIGSLMRYLRASGVNEICLCGGIQRPRFDPSLVDYKTRPLASAIEQALGLGDDGALRMMVGLFEDHGFVIRAADELLPGLLEPPGVLSFKQPDEAMRLDAKRGFEVLRMMAPLDVAQACVVGKGRVWGIEASGGTDHMIETLPSGARESNAVLVKGLKSGQDTRVDMPTIGPKTVASLVSAGLTGLVVQAGSVLFLHRDEVVQAADAAGLVLWSHPVDRCVSS